LGAALAAQNVWGIWSYVILAYAALSLLWFYSLVPALSEKGSASTVKNPTIQNKAANKVE